MSQPNTSPENIQPPFVDDNWRGWDETRSDLPIYNEQARIRPVQFAPMAPQVPHQIQYPPQGIQQVVNVQGYGPRRCRHGLHLVLTICTFGLWLPVWIIDALAKGK